MKSRPVEEDLALPVFNHFESHTELSGFYSDSISGGKCQNSQSLIWNKGSFWNVVLHYLVKK